MGDLENKAPKDLPFLIHSLDIMQQSLNEVVETEKRERSSIISEKPEGEPNLDLKLSELFNHTENATLKVLNFIWV